MLSNSNDSRPLIRLVQVVCSDIGRSAKDLLHGHGDFG